MAILIVAIAMTSAMMIAAFHSIYMERRAEIHRSHRATKRGHFASEFDRN